MRNHNFIWSKKFNLALLILGLPIIIFSQRTVTGTVNDSSTGEPLFGVNILVKETSKGAITDLDGKFSLELGEEAKILIFSYTGYESQEYVLGDSSVINISLSSGKLLEEIVVVGYGTVKREDCRRASGAEQTERCI